LLIPIPQYPLYSASIDLLGGSYSGYYLNEDDNWSTPIESIQTAYDEAIKNGKTVRALVIINPGNPTGQILTVKNQQEIVKFCVDNGIILMADVTFKQVFNKTGSLSRKYLRRYSIHILQKSCQRNG
jgi:aspartate/methionine/tyrosine aminotransferase